MRVVAAVLVAAAAAIALDVRSDPCPDARAPLPAATLDETSRVRLAAYRAGWDRACRTAAGADHVPLLAEAEALAEDVRLSRAARAVADAASGAWPLPGIRRDGAALRVDWSAFEAAAAERGTADDQRFWRAAARAADRDGDPAWLALADGEPCIRLGETDWRAVLDAVAAMEGARDAVYSRHGRALRDRLLETLQSIAAGGEVRGCTTGDAGDGLAALEDVHGPLRPIVRTVAAAAREALATGRTRVRWARGGAASGEAAAPRR